jgi:hypothetical protein
MCKKTAKQQQQSKTTGEKAIKSAASLCSKRWAKLLS